MAGIWTKPYYGVQHFQGPLPPMVRQVTVTAYESGAMAGAFGLTGFSHVWESGWLESAEAARKSAEDFIQRNTIGPR